MTSYEYGWRIYGSLADALEAARYATLAHGRQVILVRDLDEAGRTIAARHIWTRRSDY
jgi:hypothetical protein